MIFLKKKQIVVDCFTDNQNAFNALQIQNSSNFMPKWWKNMPANYSDGGLFKQPTMKTCNGLIETYKTGIILPMWCDFIINVTNKEYRWHFADEKNSANIHGHQQWDSFADPLEYGHIKISSPWRLKEKTGINWFTTLPQWNFGLNRNLFFASGMLSFKHTHELNLNFFIKLNENYEQFINVGSPIAHLIPISEKNIILKHHLIDQNEYARMAGNRVSVTNSLKKIMKMSDKLEKKCPFGF